METGEKWIKIARYVACFHLCFDVKIIYVIVLVRPEKLKLIE
jgi:hypothetical protein